MPLSSMTAFARIDAASDPYRWHWELRSVNNRGLDVRLRLPPGFDRLDPLVREQVRRRVTRGNLTANLQLDRSEIEAQVRVNEPVLDTVLALAEDVAARINADPPRVDGLLAVRGVLDVGEPEPDESTLETLTVEMLQSFSEALEALVRARQEEGVRLADIIGDRLGEIERLTAEARTLNERAPETLKARLEDQLSELLKGQPPVPEERLAQEIALLAVKADIREELDRLDAHVAQGRDLLAASEPVGRRLDFLFQEFNREANTLCSKAADVAITQVGLELKTVIDQVREQVQNVE